MRLGDMSSMADTLAAEFCSESAEKMTFALAAKLVARMAVEKHYVE